MLLFKNSLAVALLTLLTVISVAGQGRTGSRRPTSAARTGTLSLQAGVVYTNGPQPVARVEFRLLDSDLEKLLDEAGYHRKEDSSLGPLADYGFAVQFPHKRDATYSAAVEAIAKHTKATITTDFNGNGQFSPVSPGTYYVVGYSGTRKGFAIWNVKIDIKPGKNEIVLDQNNAAVAF